MPGVRSAGQKLIGCWCDSGLVDKIDRARRARTRSEFCREAIAEKLRSLGFEVGEHETASPDRTGKGRHRPVVYPIPPQAAQLNEPSSSATARSAKKPKGKSK